MLVKICGITRVDDALAAVEAGAHALGFVFWRESPRFIDPFRARAIVRRLPAFVTPVGVFVNQPPEYAAGVSRLVPLGAIQLHGDEPADSVTRIGRPVIKALKVREGVVPDASAWPDPVLLDSWSADQRGGTGEAWDWRLARELASRRQVVVAGGLNPGNVAEVVRALRPYGVDVSSGVEARVRVKDPDKMRAFVHAVRLAETHA